MVTIEPVRPDDAEKLRQEFFAPDSLAERLGSDGHWQGMGVGRLGLANPVQEAAFANLLAGRTPAGTRSLLADAPGPERPAAWRLDFDTSPSVSVLWAMAPPASRGIIERVHAECVEAALIDFEQQLCHHTIGAPQPIADQFLGGLFASFLWRISIFTEPFILMFAEGGGRRGDFDAGDGIWTTGNAARPGGQPSPRPPGIYRFGTAPAGGISGR